MSFNSLRAHCQETTELLSHIRRLYDQRTLYLTWTSLNARNSWGLLQLDYDCGKVTVLDGVHQSFVLPLHIQDNSDVKDVSSFKLGFHSFCHFSFANHHRHHVDLGIIQEIMHGKRIRLQPRRRPC
ncbi:hypothetical protein CPC08DRAFT_66135 [Agrocybe pediades]|nr:hypothetical protein CPC08DRAFT_66135 [Agrocybe pediades]